MHQPSATATRSGSLVGLLAAATPYLFFTGKGGVGKTSTAAASAIALADAGRRVLIVSTDPASNLDEVLAVDAGARTEPTPVGGVAGLHVLNIDPEAAAAAYRDRVIGPYQALLPASALAQMREELSGSCTVEIAAFNEFVTLLADADLATRFDHIVFDTAPTGHTLRLLTLPAAWAGFMTSNTSGVTCIGPISALGGAQERYAAAVDVLRDAARTTIVLVTRPEPVALAEAARAAGELRELGLAYHRLIINGVFETSDPTDAVAAAWQQRGEQALAAMPAILRQASGVDQVPLLAEAPIGIPGLRRLLHPAGPADTLASGEADPGWPRGLAHLIDDLAPAGSGVIMTMGKGGVGKTTVAAAIAVALAQRGAAVTLTTTDPAAHVADLLPDPPDNLRVTRVDPQAETAAYTAQVLAEAGTGMSADAYALLEEDLRSPCTEEVAVFRAFARTVAQATNRFVVIDTAPTGHTLLLLDASRSFTRQLDNQAGAVPAGAARLLDTLTDPERTRILLVTLPEATPVHEAARLQDDLARAGITPYAWVVNASLAATHTTDPVLAARARHEHRWLAEITTHHAATRHTLLPWAPQPPVGCHALAAYATTW